MNTGPQGSGNRWWEIRGAGQPDEGEGGYRELMTDSRGRSRPERSLSVGVDLAEESGSAARAFRWPIVSAVAAIGLILSVGYVVSTGTSHQPGNAMAAPPAPRSSTPGNTQAKPDPDATPDRGSRPVRSGPPPARPPADSPRSPVVLPGSPAGNPGPVVTPNRQTDPPNGRSGDTGGDTGNQQTGTPAPGSTAPAQEPSVTFDSLDGTAPPTPKSQQVGAMVPPVTGGGCTKKTRDGDNDLYACDITRDAPFYLAGKRRYYAALEGDYTWFRCQSKGSKYSVGDRVSHWWARLSQSPDLARAAWVPVVFLKGTPRDDKPVPGLPLCAGASEPAPESTGSTPGTSVEPARSGRR